MLFDSHAHISFEQYNEDRVDVIKRAREAGLTGWLEVGTDLAQSKKALALAKQEKGVVASVGVHPHDYRTLSEETWREIEALLHQPAAAAVGEVGFDVYRGGNIAEQRPIVERWITVAQEVAKPIIWHVRNSNDEDAHEALLQVLEAAGSPPSGVVHTYSGTVAQAERYLALGLHLSISGVVTFKNAGELVEVVRQAPLERLLVETDAPFLAPVPHRGQRNEPAYVTLVADKVAQIRGVDFESVAQQVTANAQDLFNG